MNYRQNIVFPCFMFKDGMIAVKTSPRTHLVKRCIDVSVLEFT